jgi:sulfite exporter TauE/SafE
MYVMSAGTGSPKEGAAILLFFGLGTLGPLLGFGLLASIVSPNVRGQLVRASGILMVVMGVLMVDRGVKLTRSAHGVGSVLSPWTQLGLVVPPRREPVSSRATNIERGVTGEIRVEAMYEGQ